jgi:nucleoside-diphosphate-sugar epimerase
MKKVLVIGCGWLGLPLALKLKDLGYSVMGTTRNPDRQKALETRDIPYFSSPEIPLNEHFDAVICTLTPPKTEADRAIHEKIASQAKDIAQFIYTSSISIYPDIEATVTEVNEDESSPIFALESIYTSQLPQAVILRLGGLHGFNRHPARFLSGRKNVAKPMAPINLVSGLEVISAIELVLRKDITGEIYNIVSEDHRTRIEFYSSVCDELGIPRPEFENTSEGGKLVDTSKWKQVRSL